LLNGIIAVYPFGVVKIKIPQWQWEVSNKARMPDFGTAKNTEENTHTPSPKNKSRTLTMYSSALQLNQMIKSDSS
jgi:hypothetical protein